jgi:PAS domain S-box-containing protein
MIKILKLLQVEDSESDAALIVRQLNASGFTVESERAQDAREMRDALSRAAWDAVVSDFRMPGFDAHEALAVLQETGLDIPFLVVSGTIGEDTAVSLMKAGAHDYLMKDNLKRLGVAVERELRDAEARRKSKDAARKLEASEARLSLAIRATDSGIFDNDPRTGATLYSDIARRHLMLPKGDEPRYESFLDSLHPEDRPVVERAVAKALSPYSRGHYAAEYRLKTPEGEPERWISASGSVLFDERRTPVRFLGVVRDISDQKLADKHLQFQLQLNAAVVEQSKDCIILADLGDRVQLLNSAVTRTLGFTLADFQSKTAHEVIHHHYPDGRPFPISECAVARLVNDGGVLQDREGVLFDKAGKMVPVSLTASPLVLNGSRIGTILTFRDITERKQAEAALHRSERRFRRLFEAEIIGIAVGDRQLVLECNDHFLRILGYTREEFFSRNRNWSEFNAPEYEKQNAKAMEALRTTGVCAPFEKEYVRKDGSRIPVLFAGVYLQWPDEGQSMVFAINLTERRKLENQFRQAQKLESVGLLAGGVAHDFNNLLTVILGYSDVLRGAVGGNGDLRTAADEIAEAANRAAILTRQLLTFSRKNAGAPETISVNDLVRGIERLLARLIGVNVEIVVLLGDDAGSIYADRGMIEQAIMNLAVNARDVMPHGGRLMIGTSRVFVEEEFASVSGIMPHGEYVSIEVSDTGSGMTPEVQAHIFEPFFTTKGPGKGTGLGLSTVYGIVKQTAGYITVDSAPGEGTVFRLFLPPTAPKEEQDAQDSEPQRTESYAPETLAQGGPPAAAERGFPLPGGAHGDPWWAESPLDAKPPISTQALPQGKRLSGLETVLVVEDETSVRNYIRRALESHGYSAISCPTGREALETASGYKKPIHLLLTDVILPGMSGTETARRFLLGRPGTPVLYISGYPERFGQHLGNGVPYVQKPFRIEELLTRIRGLLDASGGSGKRDAYLEHPAQGDVAREDQVQVPGDVAQAKSSGDSSKDIPLEAEAALVIDDSGPVRTIVALSLREAGYRVVEAATREEAMSAFEAGRFSLAIGDLNLDGQASGLALLNEMVRMRPELKCVLMTGSFTAGQRLPMPYPLLAKPFVPEELIALAQRLVPLPRETTHELVAPPG